MSAQRVISLLPATTEIVCALGFEERLVGRSHECDFPASVKRLPALTEPKIDINAISRDIQREVSGIVRNALSIYRVDADRLRALSPDLILTQSQCEVCAVSERDLEDALADWMGTPPTVLSLSPERLTDVWDDVTRVAEAMDDRDRAARVTGELRERTARIETRSAALIERPRVACVEWIEPLMAAGNWVPELVGMAGGANLFGEVGEHSPWMPMEDLAEADPDVMVIMPCGFDIDRTRSELGALMDHPAWSGIKAVRDGRVYLTDGMQYFSRPGPRLVESLEILAEMIHPEEFDFGHEGSGWARL